jgi:serine protease Do
MSSTNRSWIKRYSVFLGVPALIAAGFYSHQLLAPVAVAQAPAVVAPTVTPKVTEAERQAALGHAKALSTAFRAVAEKASPAVVKIHAVTKAKLVRRNNPDMNQPNPFKGTPFEEMFPDFQDQLRGNGRTPQRDGVGSGVIVDRDGIVLTNNHVVENADEVTVQTADGREFKAYDIKTDPESDLAVLRIRDARDLTAASIGNSDAMSIGDWVVAIGNPFELEQTVSTGIISGKGRELGMIRRSKFLQTDAAINPGNSGGPLLNLDGEVIGINTAIASNTGSFNGIGFAIPSNHARWIMQQLLSNGSVQRGYLGVGVSLISPDLSRKLQLAPNTGVIVGEVQPDSPAAKAGIAEGDVILNVNGNVVRTPRDLQEQIERFPTDSRVTLAILRDGKQLSVNANVKPLPEQLANARPRAENSGRTPSARGVMATPLGIEVANLGPNESRRLNNVSGVVITQVEPDSPAAEKGLQPGMVIRKVGTTPVSNTEEFQAALQKEKSPDGIILQIRTEQGNRFVVVEPKVE